MKNKINMHDLALIENKNYLPNLTGKQERQQALYSCKQIPSAEGRRNSDISVQYENIKI